MTLCQVTCVVDLLHKTSSYMQIDLKSDMLMPHFKLKKIIGNLLVGNLLHSSRDYMTISTFNLFKAIIQVVYVQ